MQPIRVLSPELNLLAEIDDYESLIFINRWHKPGEFDLYINKHKKHTDKLVEGNIVYLSPKKAGIIRKISIKLKSSGKQSEVLEIKGASVSGIIGQRIIIPPTGQAHDEVTGNVETVIKHFVDNQIANPDNLLRKVAVLETATDQSKGEEITRRGRFQKLSNFIESISKYSGLGWNVEVDIVNEKLVFEVYEGKILTTEQVENPPVIVSPEFGIVESMDYTLNKINYKNFAYVGGQGEGTERTVEEVGEAEGMDRFESFIDANQEEDGNLVSVGEQNLADSSVDKYFEAEILHNSSFVYEQDYNLGDLITIQNLDWNITMNARIVEIQEEYERSGFKLELTFNRSSPNLISEIKKEMDSADFS